MDRQTNQLGGGMLAAAAVLGVLGGAFHAPQPGTLDAFAQIDLGRWRASHVSIALAGSLYVVSALFLARHFSRSRAEGLALAGAGALLLAGLALVAVGAIETTGFSRLIALQANDPMAAAHGFQAVSITMQSLLAPAPYAFPLAVIAFGAVMLRAGGPQWLGWAGVAIGVGMLALRLFGITIPAPFTLIPNYVSSGWFVIFAAYLAQARSGERAAVEEMVGA